MSTKTEIKRLGIDIGRVIIEGGTKDMKDTTFVDAQGQAEYLNTPEVEGAVESITQLVEMFDGNVWLISKCYENTQKKTRKWLAKQKFFRTTGVKDHRIIFCLERRQKVGICEDLGITHFIDDRMGCLAPMNGKVRYRFLFGPQDPEQVLHDDPVEPSVALVYAESWRTLMRYFIPPTI